MLIYDIALLLYLIGNSEGTKLLILLLTVILCFVFTAPANWRVELRAKIGHYRNRCFRLCKAAVTPWVKQFYDFIIYIKISSTCQAIRKQSNIDMYRLKMNKFYTYIHKEAYQNHIENIFPLSSLKLKC